ncbi:cupin domain-containing protein [Hymenobacter busanensis]|uniref:Cupin domain-containing protein n=1 Tax=Hymenobacter busanensis TaxID=2607656 RepID=A0A7L5A1S1_9BACT|nr:cupin domain-containing protein [Hymenobacter busanensis]KAA9325336.1 cupin domain-containing protein [Hymenobacter busanensis]QHJ07670.1 cupin domain-containing protein [Hymenobacter busanensis]
MNSVLTQSGSLLAGHHTPIGEQKGLVLFNRNGQKVIYKTFQSGEVMPTHHSAEEVLVTCLAGQLELELGGSTTLLEAGDYLIIPAAAPHALRCRSDAKLLIFR